MFPHMINYQRNTLYHAGRKKDILGYFSEENGLPIHLTC